MTTNEPLLSAEQRERLERWHRNVPGNVAPAIKAALAEIDRLASQVDALATELAHVCHDRMEEGARALIERAVSEEREAISGIFRVWLDTDADPKLFLDNIANRGPILPPLPPYRAQEENERLRAVLERLVDLVDPDTTGPALLGLRPDAVEIATARELLKCAAGGRPRYNASRAVLPNKRY